MQNFKNNSNSKLKSHSIYLVTGLVLSLFGFESALAIDLDAGAKAATEPVTKMINSYYPVGIFITGAFGAFLQPQGDLRERMIGFGKGALVGGLTIAAVKAGLGV